MSKIVKTLIFLVIILFSITTLAFATDIDMNLENPNENPVDANTTSNAVDANSIDDTSDTNTMENPEEFQQDSISGTAAPSGVSSIAQENMSFSNILNILIITVGVILILLAIAILIRLKN